MLVQTLLYYSPMSPIRSRKIHIKTVLIGLLFFAYFNTGFEQRAGIIPLFDGHCAVGMGRLEMWEVCC